MARDADILGNILTTLQGINGVAPYGTDVSADVHDEHREPDDLGLPAVCFFVVGDDPDHTEAFDVIEQRMLVWVVGYVEAATQALRRAALSTLRQDIRIAMFTDPTRGGNARDTRPGGRVEIAYGEADENFGSMLIPFLIIYAVRTATADS